MADENTCLAGTRKRRLEQCRHRTVRNEAGYARGVKMESKALGEPLSLCKACGVLEDILVNVPSAHSARTANGPQAVFSAHSVSAPCAILV